MYSLPTGEHGRAARLAQRASRRAGGPLPCRMIMLGSARGGQPAYNSRIGSRLIANELIKFTLRLPPYLRTRSPTRCGGSMAEKDYEGVR